MASARWSTAALAVLLIAVPASALATNGAPQFARLFSDHAVLQRGQPIHLWGSAAPSQTLHVALDRQTAVVTAGADGQWKSDLAAMPAGGPYTLSVTNEAGLVTTLSDVMIGDVFLCSGQSNMEFALKYATNTWGAAYTPLDTNLRFVMIGHGSSAVPMSDLVDTANWQVVGPKTAGEASAVCYFMSKAIEADQHVPIGMIDAYWGGTVAQAWISDAGLRALHMYDSSLDALALYARSPEEAKANWSKTVATSWQASEPDATTKRAWIKADFNDRDWKTVTPVGIWEESGDPDLANFDGIVWYRTRMTLSAAQAREAERITLGPIDDMDITWINGVMVGTGSNWEEPRNYPIPPHALKAGPNEIVVRVIDTGGGGGLWGKPSDRTFIFPDGTTLPLPTVWKYRISGQPSPGVTLPSVPWASPNGLANLYNAMIAPLTPYHIKAVAWYQGEANTYSATEYGRLLPALMHDWRSHFQEPELPFLVVQLAAFGPVAVNPGSSKWAELRDVQRRVVDEDPHAGLAVTIDVGDRTDIHPSQKTVVGNRLARAAQAVVYSEHTSAGGPDAETVTREGSDLVVHFRNTNGGLQTYSSGQALSFEVCGAFGACRYASARPEKDTVVLSGANTTSAVKVRYAWADSPYTNLYSGDDLPAAPFQMDISP